MFPLNTGLEITEKAYCGLPLGSPDSPGGQAPPTIKGGSEAAPSDSSPKITPPKDGQQIIHSYMYAHPPDLDSSRIVAVWAQRGRYLIYPAPRRAIGEYQATWYSPLARMSRRPNTSSPAANVRQAKGDLFPPARRGGSLFAALPLAASGLCAAARVGAAASTVAVRRERRERSLRLRAG